MQLRTIQEELVTIGRQAYAKGLTSGSSGNISCRLAEGAGIVIKRTGCPMADAEWQDYIPIAMSGDSLVEARPSIETVFHLAIYRERPEVNAVVHLHPPYSTAWAVAGIPLPLGTVAAKEGLGQIGFVAYHEPGSEGLSREVAEVFRDTSMPVALLERHGIISVGRTLREAYYRAEMLEDTAQVLLLSKLVPRQ